MHPAVILLGVATVGLLVARRIRLRWSGVAAGSLVALAAAAALARRGARTARDAPDVGGFRRSRAPAALPGARRQLLAALRDVPSARARRRGSTSRRCSTRARWRRLLRALGDVMVKGVGPATFLIAAAANVWLWRRWRRRGWRRLLVVAGAGAREWTLGVPADHVPRLAGGLRARSHHRDVVAAGAAAARRRVDARALAAGALARRRPRLVRIGAAAWAVISVGAGAPARVRRSAPPLRRAVEHRDPAAPRSPDAPRPGDPRVVPGADPARRLVARRAARSGD